MTTYQNINPNWDEFKNRATWGYVSTPELAKVLNVSLQTINNWLLREKLPKPTPNPKFRGNKNFWRISYIRSFFESRPEEEIHREWIDNNLVPIFGSPMSYEQALAVYKSACTIPDLWFEKI